MSADLEIEGRMPWSSNATFAVSARSGDSEHRAIYKPIRGERPLWDFEPGLHRRERAAYVVSESLGVGAVPPTVIRDGPLGVGSSSGLSTQITRSITSPSTSREMTFTTNCEESQFSILRQITPTGKVVTAYLPMTMCGRSITDYVSQLTTNSEPSSGTSAESRSRLSIGRLLPILQITHQRNSMNSSIVTRWKHFESAADSQQNSENFRSMKQATATPGPLCNACRRSP